MDTTTPVPEPSAPLVSAEARYNDLLKRLGVSGHDGAVAEIAALRQNAGLKDADVELDEQLARGRMYAGALAHHLYAMSAARLNIPIETPDGTIMVAAGYTSVPSGAATAVERAAQALYEAYCDATDWKAFNGSPLPQWAEFVADPAKQKQASAWRAAAAVAVTSGMGMLMPAQPA